MGPNKTGTTTIADTLVPQGIAFIPKHLEYESARHMFWNIQIKDHMDYNLWFRLFKFSSVRNPWERLVSWWKFLQSDDPHAVMVRKKHGLDKNFEFWQFLTDERLSWRNRSQINFTHDKNGNTDLDYIIKHENFSQDFKYVCERLGAKFIDVCVNKGTYQKDWRFYWTDKMLKIPFVREYCEKEAKLYGYSFDS